MKQQRACDRCKATKSKCVRLINDTICQRCQRLHHECTYKTEPKPPGRKPLGWNSDLSSLMWIEEKPIPRSISSSAPSLDGDNGYGSRTLAGDIGFLTQDKRCSTSAPITSLSLLPLSMGEYHLVHHMLDDDSVDHPFFRLGNSESMKTELRRTIKEHLDTAPALLLAPFVVMWKRVISAQMGGSACGEADLKRSSNAIQSLRTIKLDKKHRIVDVLSLAICLMTFNEAISGTAAPSVCRHTLSLLRDVTYMDIWSDSSISSEIHCLIWSDTRECLVHRQVPVLRYNVTSSSVVDSYSGIASTLLPTLYSVCQLGAATKAGINLDAGTCELVEQQLRGWEPSPPHDFWEQPLSEIMSLMTHAKLYQAMALLLFLQLLHPWERLDERASIASRVLDDLASYLSVEGQVSSQFALPLLVIGVELSDPTDKDAVLSYLRIMLGAEMFAGCRNVSSFLELVWSRRDSGSLVSWFDILDEAPYFTLPG